MSRNKIAKNLRSKINVNIERLSSNAFPVPTNTFCFCQLCGKNYDDICSISLWQECSANEKPENIFLLVGKDCCEKKIIDSPRRYNLLPWSAAGPGKFTLICGNCPFRSNFNCTHPNLKENGGEGLLVNFVNPLGANIHISMSNGSGRWLNMNVANKCEGNKQSHN